jgi:hypothetical protein
VINNGARIKHGQKHSELHFSGEKKCYLKTEGGTKYIFLCENTSRIWVN